LEEGNLADSMLEEERRGRRGRVYVGCPRAGEGGLDFGAEEVWEPGEAVSMRGLVSERGPGRCGYHGWSSISKTCMRGTHGAILLRLELNRGVKTAIWL
jgi:hypothetical protein